jgi:NAD(P)-dependent dehydrogenase (short-subunit alcohol dehydrogenase family)
MEVNWMRSSTATWFITGCSTGFGRILAAYLLKRGNNVVATARDPTKLHGIDGKGEKLLLKLDVTDERQIVAAVRAAEERFGQIDVLVNNAGIGYFAAIEEGEDDQIRKMFEVNVFGLTWMINATLPGMRKRGMGFIINLSSLAGLRASPALGYYNATKFAVEGLSGALRKELEPLGISVMLVEPSGFRTDWAGRSANESKTVIADYANTAGAARHQLRESSGKQPGDPVRAVEAIVQAVEFATPPAHLLLGNDAYDGAMANLGALRKCFEAWEAVTRGADSPAPTVATAA